MKRILQWLANRVGGLSTIEKLRRAQEESLRHHCMIKLHRFELRKDFVWVGNLYNERDNY